MRKLYRNGEVLCSISTRSSLCTTDIQKITEKCVQSLSQKKTGSVESLTRAAATEKTVTAALLTWDFLDSFGWWWPFIPTSGLPFLLTLLEYSLAIYLWKSHRNKWGPLLAEPVGAGEGAVAADHHQVGDPCGEDPNHPVTQIKTRNRLGLVNKKCTLIRETEH